MLFILSIVVLVCFWLVLVHLFRHHCIWKFIILRIYNLFIILFQMIPKQNLNISQQNQLIQCILQKILLLEESRQARIKAPRVKL